MTRRPVPMPRRRLLCLIRTVSRAEFVAAIVAAVCIVAAVVLGGCAVGYPVLADGTADLSKPSIGIGIGAANQVMARAVQTVAPVAEVATGLLTPLLVGSGVGVPLVTTLGIALNKLFKSATERATLAGKEAGWEDAEAARLKRLGIVAATKETA